MRRGCVCAHNHATRSHWRKGRPQSAESVCLRDWPAQSAHTSHRCKHFGHPRAHTRTLTLTLTRTHRCTHRHTQAPAHARTHAHTHTDAVAAGQVEILSFSVTYEDGLTLAAMARAAGGVYAPTTAHNRSTHTRTHTHSHTDTDTHTHTRTHRGTHARAACSGAHRYVRLPLFEPPVGVRTAEAAGPAAADAYRPLPRPGAPTLACHHAARGMQRRAARRRATCNTRHATRHAPCNNHRATGNIRHATWHRPA